MNIRSDHKKIDWKTARYEKSGPGKDLPIIKGPSGKPLIEVAFCGKSNAGKSSLLNDLTEQKELARVSKTPGKTQLIHLFSVGSSFVLVDLPGYGFAKVPDAVKKSWAEGLEHYFTHRDSLALILLLIDIRRTPSQEDLEMAAWAKHFNKNITLILTKTDKITHKERIQNTKEILDAFSMPEIACLHYSIQDGEKTLQARRTLRSHIIEQLFPLKEPS